MTSGQDIRGIPVIETPDSDDDMPRKPQPRKNVAPGRAAAAFPVRAFSVVGRQREELLSGYSKSVRMTRIRDTGIFITCLRI